MSIRGSTHLVEWNHLINRRSQSKSLLEFSVARWAMKQSGAEIDFT